MADLFKRVNSALGQYSDEVRMISDVGQTLVLVADVILAVQLAMADGQLTPSEIRDLSAKLAKLQPILKAAQSKLGK